MIYSPTTKIILLVLLLSALLSFCNGGG